ncbi:MAG: DUF3098 domain-containing protein [Bacteroidetes bacterium]|uniref:DUF3098 domain-containing protein n=1 Tax=Candidatus Egerieousia excrementavium TaxID=2840778 RepID=A0A9D9GZ59_9BACT|nr:DUF3098 domain-containing protein [Candidatus Egerieousia excrementavium]
MAEIKNKEEMASKPFAIPVRNVTYIIAGLGVMILGYLLMIGGGPDSPDVFNPEMFSFRRIVLAPVVILIGIAIEVVAIMYRGKSKK